MTAADRLFEPAEQLLGSAQLELDRARRRRLEIRAELVAADAEVARLWNLVSSLRGLLGEETPADDPSDDAALVGWRVGEAAMAVLSDVGEPMHYRDVWTRMQATGAVIESDEPEAVVLTQLTRHPEIERVGRGQYRARPLATERLMAVEPAEGTGS